MKTRNVSVVKLIVSIGIIALAGLWMYKAKEPFDTLAYVILGSMLLIAGFQMYFAIRAFKNEQAGLTPEDELSKRIKEKAFAKAFKLSILMWLFGVLFLIEPEMPAKLVAGIGMLGMGLIFIFTWFYISKVGISDEN